MFRGNSKAHTLTLRWCCDDFEGGVVETVTPIYQGNSSMTPTSGLTWSCIEE